MLGSLHEVRPGRTIYIETFFGNPSGQLAPSNLVALLVIGCNCRHQQASVKQQRESLHHMPANLPETASETGSAVPSRLDLLCLGHHDVQQATVFDMINSF